MHRDLPVRVCWISAWLLLTGPLLVRVCVILGTPASGLRDVVDFIFDDGYYYLSIAANVAELGRSTFDGITATNGYQPLWLLVLAGLAKVVGTQTRTFFLASCGLIYAIAWVTPLLAIVSWPRSDRRGSLAFATGLALVIIHQPIVFLQGLEPILFAPLSAVLVVLLERADSDPKTLRELSIALAACFLIRLDSLALFVSVAICLPVFEVLGRTAKLSRYAMARRVVGIAARLSLFVLPTLIAYLAINQWLFGSPVPISGVAKLIGGARFSNWGATFTFFGSKNSFALLIAILVALEMAARMSDRRPGPVFYRSIAILLLALAFQIFYYAAFSAWYIWPWYTYLVALLMALMIARIVYLSTLLYPHSRARIVAASALLIVGAWTVVHSVALARDSGLAKLFPALSSHKSRSDGNDSNAVPQSFNQISMDMLGDFFRPGHHTFIAMGDRAGGLAYWGRSKLSILQTEGLTFDAGYLKARAENRGEQYLEQFPIEYLVVDREVIATVKSASHEQLVIPEPIQGRINISTVPTFCFPSEAIKYQKKYRSDYGINRRVAFSFAEREPCMPEAIAMMRSIEGGIGLRQYSLPSEYNHAEGGILDRRIENRDRHLAGAL